MNRNTGRARYRRADGTQVLGAQLPGMTDEELLALYEETRKDMDGLAKRMMQLSDDRRTDTLEMEGAKTRWRLARVFRCEAACLLIDRELQEAA
ncbi:MAG: hypothetical protein ACK5JJ_11170 [Cyanobacteriota bacterium]